MVLLTTSQQNEISLEFNELLNQSNYTILYFYPKDNTSGCTLEANEFSWYSKEFEKLGCQIIGVSKDNHTSHCKFISKYDLAFQLISDSDLELHTMFHTLGEKSLYGKKYIGTIRSTFLLDQKGNILYERRNASASNHAKKVLEKTQEVVMDKLNHNN
jgi:peroxiredoxin Q/BCP